ncbi:LysR family transcriptional regulator [Brevibacillus fluminis]|uniref:LysR family transcriptional regulator n=1 Tax=Brevibacillus fluminis TaxID=511487 RepID=UPI003F8A1912
MMDLRFLKTFQTIVRSGSFQQAAEKLQYAQSTVTAQIQKLESDLGILLFDRIGKRAVLTEAGRLLYEQSKQILQDVEKLQQTITDISTGYSGHVRIGAIEPTASVRLPGLIRQFCQERPLVNLTLEVGTALPLHQRILADELDFAISTMPASGLGLMFEPLFSERFGLLVPADHPFADQPHVPAADLSRHRLILPEPTCAYKEMIERILMENDIKLQSNLQIGSIDAMKQLVQAKVGIALIPLSSSATLADGVLLKPVEDIKLQVSIGLVHREEHHRFGLAVKAFLDLCRSELGSAGRKLA